MNIIGLSEETKEYINTITNEMEKLGVLEDADRKNLDLLASQVELYIRAMADIDENGITTLGQGGRLVANPAVSVQRSCMTQITSLLRELSLSMKQRKMIVKDVISDEPDPLDIFLEKMNG